MPVLRPLLANESRPNPDGTSSTELLRAESINENEHIVIPSLFSGPDGLVELDADGAVRAALDYERRTGNRFPRFDNIEDAISASMSRSETGGTASGPLAKPSNPESNTMPFDTPQQPATRNPAPPGLGMLMQLLGREGNPTLPPVQQSPMQALIDAMEGARGNDPQRFGDIRQLIEQRNPDDVARGQGPQATGVESVGKTSAEKSEKTFNPFKILSDALEGSTPDLSPRQ